MEKIKQFTVKVNQNAAFASDLSGDKFQHQQFTDFSGINITLTDCDFSYALFQRAYFRNVNFINCNFTGAKFFDSNLRDAEFESCKFHYAIFKFTLIRSSQVLNNLPEWPNVKTILLQNHKANANSFGDTKAVREYLLEEIESNKEHLRRARRRNEAYYSKKYQGFQAQVKVIWKLFWLNVDSFLWGHGESPWRILINVLIAVLIVSIFQMATTIGILSTSTQDFFAHGWYLLKSDVKVLIGVSSNEVGSISKALLILLRYLTLGLFIRILFNKYSWR